MQFFLVKLAYSRRFKTLKHGLSYYNIIDEFERKVVPKIYSEALLPLATDHLPIILYNIHSALYTYYCIVGRQSIIDFIN